jgi:hypothetical protein
MRTEILIWSTISGAVLGLFAGVALVATGVVVHAILPATEGRALARLLPAALAAGLVVLPAVGAVLGYLEGTLKVH